MQRLQIPTQSEICALPPLMGTRILDDPMCFIKPIHDFGIQLRSYCAKSCNSNEVACLHTKSIICKNLYVQGAVISITLTF